MTSIFDQYEATMSRGHSNVVPTQPSTSSSSHEPISSGFINAAVEDTTPIFNKSKINFKPEEPITHLTICNNMLCMILSKRKLLRINLLHPDNVEQVEVTKGNERVYKIFFDPTGRFLLITLTSEETLFLSSNSQKHKILNKFKGHTIESVAWSRTANGNKTGAVLVGTSRGLIMECCIEAGEETKFFAGSVDQYFHQVFELPKVESKGSPILGLEYFCSVTRDSSRNSYCIFAMTSSKLFQFSGMLSNTDDPPIFRPFFAFYKNVHPRFIDLPGFIDNSQLIFLYDLKSQSAQIPTQLAWLAAPGIYIGDVSSSSSAKEASSQQRSLITNAKLVMYPNTKREANSNPFADAEDTDTVLNIVLTEFHVLLLYSDRMKVICALNEQLIFEDVYTSRYGQLKGLVKDPMKGTIWSFTERAVFKYKVVKESRDVWQMYLDMDKFDLAMEYCRDNPANLDKVRTRQAEHAFQQGQYQESALYYATTQNSFEYVALKFIRAGEEAALRAFLQKKLVSLKPTETIQMTLLTTWLVELYLNQLGKLREKEEDKDAMAQCREKLRKLLAQSKFKQSYQENRSTIYELLISHGDIEDYVFFAVLMQDYERVVNHHIQNEDFAAALEALRKQNNITLYYKFSPVLMQHIPEKTVDAWIHIGRRLDPRHLIPSLVNCTQTCSSHQAQWMEAVRYLEHCTGELNCTDPAIHNYLLSLYVKHKPTSTLKYLKDQGDDPAEVQYDVKYALRLCLDDAHQDSKPVLHRACVLIYTVMGLYEEAVAMALKVDVELAKSVADQRKLEEEDEELKKKLWLRIAKHVVQEDKDIQRAMKFLQESGDLLKIEDILPFFPDFVTIDHFKNALCESLAEYNKHIDELKEEMNDATSSAHSIRASIQETKNRHLVVGETERCSSCGRQLLSRGFYLFPCEHAFHSDCLWNEVRPMLIDAKRAASDRLQQELMALNQSPTPTSEEEIRQRRIKRQKLILELDETIANECVLCGEIAIRAIDAPFFDDDDGDEDSWS